MLALLYSWQRPFPTSPEKDLWGTTSLHFLLSTFSSKDLIVFSFRCARLRERAPCAVSYLTHPLPGSQPCEVQQHCLPTPPQTQIWSSPSPMKTLLLTLSRRRLRIIKRSFMRPGHAKWNRARERPRKAASRATGAQRDPCPRSASVTALATLH